MKSKHSLFVMLVGWLIASAYLLYDYNTFGSGLLKHLADFKNPFEVFLHIVIFSALIGSHVTAYLINDRKKLLERTKHSEQQIMSKGED